MKKNIITIIVFVFSIITMASSVLYITTEIMIPSLGPFSLAIVMLGLVYLSKKQYEEGRIKRGYWRFMLYIGLTAGILNIIAGISQIMVAI